MIVEPLVHRVVLRTVNKGLEDISEVGAWWRSDCARMLGTWAEEIHVKEFENNDALQAVHMSVDLDKERIEMMDGNTWSLGRNVLRATGEVACIVALEARP